MCFVVNTEYICRCICMAHSVHEEMFSQIKVLYIDVNKRNITHEMPFTIEGILLLLCDHNLYIQYATNNI